MRITNGMIRNSSLNALYDNMGRMNTLFDQMNTLKKIQRPSDDPIVAGRSLKLRLNVMESEQHKSNVDEAKAWMDVSETALSNMTTIIKEIRTRANQAANGTLTSEDKQKVAGEIAQLYKQLEQEANVTYAGRYVFSGFKTNQKVILEDGTINPEVSGEIEGQDIYYEIGVSNTINVNITGVPKFMEGMKQDIEHMLKSLDGAMTEPPTVTDQALNELFTGMIAAMDGHLKDVSAMEADLGSRQNRLAYTATRLSDDATNLTELLTKTEDVDLEEVYVNFNTQYMVYQSALQATSKVVMNTLADFLR